MLNSSHARYNCWGQWPSIDSIMLTALRPQYKQSSQKPRNQQEPIALLTRRRWFVARPRRCSLGLARPRPCLCVRRDQLQALLVAHAVCAALPHVLRHHSIHGDGGQHSAHSTLKNRSDKQAHYNRHGRAIVQKYNHVAEAETTPLL